MTIQTVKEIRARQEARRKELAAALDRLIARLAELGALRIVLFGSFARGEVRSGTDLDLICVMPPERSGREWMRTIYSEIDRDVDCDILAYTEEELARHRRMSRFLRHALETGRVVFEKRPED